MLFARWQHYLRFCSGFPYAPLKAMVTKISKWSRIQDSFRIIPKIESLVVCAIPDIPSKFQKDPSITFKVILLTHKQTDKQSRAKTIYLLGGGNKLQFCLCACVPRVTRERSLTARTWSRDTADHRLSACLVADQLCREFRVLVDE